MLKDNNGQKMSSELLDSARQGRSSGAVLKLELSHLRSRRPDDVVFILEGKDDYGPYDCWLKKIALRYPYSLLPGKGKGQLLDLRRRLSNDQNDLDKGVYFVIDRDYDNLRDQRPGPDVYLTDTYSVENYLVNEDVLRNVLLDELQLAGDPSAVDHIVKCYEAACHQFGVAMTKANCRIYCRSKLQLEKGALENRLSRFVTIELNTVVQIYDCDALVSHVPLCREPTDDEQEKLNIEFHELKSQERHRGKYWLSFFYAWLDNLAFIRKCGTDGKVPTLVSLKFNSSKLSMRSLASRRLPPDSLQTFVQSAAR